MKYYSTTPQGHYKGRPSGPKAYMYQKIQTAMLAVLQKDKKTTNQATESLLVSHPLNAALGKNQSKTPKKTPHFGILGYGVDHGVALNHGRIGAASGPDAFRQCFGPLAQPIISGFTITDFGTVYCPDKNLGKAQENLGKGVYELLSKKIKPIIIGGGHDMAYGHFLGIHSYMCQYNTNAALGVINLDAHLDLRMPSPEGTSGTPFQQMALKTAAHGKTLPYCCVGLRENANPPNLINQAKNLNVSLIYREDCENYLIEKVWQRLLHFIAPLNWVYLSIDLDVFHQGVAPGVSAASPLGFEVGFGMEIVKRIAGTGKLISLDIAELNPALDQNQSTAKLAAGLASQGITHWK